MTQIQLSEKLGISKRSIIKNMKGLKDKQKIKRVGSDRKGFWEILNWLIKSESDSFRFFNVIKVAKQKKNKLIKEG